MNGGISAMVASRMTPMMKMKSRPVTKLRSLNTAGVRKGRMALDRQLGIAAQACLDACRLLLQAGHRRPCRLEFLAGGIELRLRHELLRRQPLQAAQLACLVPNIAAGALELLLRSSVGGPETLDLVAGDRELRPCAAHRDPVRRVVDLDQQLTRLDPLIGRHRHRQRTAGDLGRDRQHVGLHVGVVGADVAPAAEIEPEVAVSSVIKCLLLLPPLDGRQIGSHLLQQLHQHFPLVSRQLAERDRLDRDHPIRHLLRRRKGACDGRLRAGDPRRRLFLVH
jgi:hypothetical protein